MWWGAMWFLPPTSDVYGMSADLPYREDGDLLLGPSMIKRWSYARLQAVLRAARFAYYQDCRVPMVCLRYFGGFSPRSSFKWSGGHVPIFIHAILNDEEVIVHGDGAQTRSMGFVTDLVEGRLAGMGRMRRLKIPIGERRGVSVLETARAPHRANTGKELRLASFPCKRFFRQVQGHYARATDLSKAKALLGLLAQGQHGGGDPAYHRGG